MIIFHPLQDPDDDSEEPQESDQADHGPAGRDTPIEAPIDDPAEWKVLLPRAVVEHSQTAESADHHPPASKSPRARTRPEPRTSTREKGLTRRSVVSHALTAGAAGTAAWLGTMYWELNPKQDTVDEFRSTYDDDGPLDVVALPEHYQTMQGELWVLPEPIAADEEIPSWFDDFEEWEVWRTRHGAMDLTYTLVRLVVENTWSNDVTLTEISADVTREAPLTGTLMWAPPQGGDSLTAMGFSLDESEPHAREIDWDLFDATAFPSAASPENYLTNRPYLTSGGIMLPSQGVRTLFILAGGVSHFYEFTIRIKGIVNQEAFEQTIDNQGEPFRVTAAPAYIENDGVREIDRSAFDVVYEYDFANYQWARNRG